MAAESCHSRSLSWLVKSCIPDPNLDISIPKRIPIPNPTTTTTDSSSATSLCPLLSLPDELLLECLIRLPHSDFFALRFVCLRFHELLHSHSFYQLRRSRKLLLPYLLLISVSDLHVLTSALLPFTPSPTCFALAAFPLPTNLRIPHGAFSYPRPVVLNSRSVYLIGRGAMLEFDALTGAVRGKSPTLYPRKKFAAAVVDGKIYVAGGSAKTAAVEEYDPEADTWRVVADSPRPRYGCVGAGTRGAFYVAGGVTVGGRSLDAHVCAGSMDAFRVSNCGWGRPRTVPGGGCVLGVCGVGEHVYVLASHAVEVSFWRWEGRRRGGGPGSGVGWLGLEAPPLPVGPGKAVRVGLALVGSDKVVAVASVAAVRGGVGGGGPGGEVVEGVVLVYDVKSGKWARVTDVPAGFKRAACAGVEC